MKESETYVTIWKRYLPLITMKLKQVIRNNETSFIGMYPFEFHTVGKKRKIGHQFDLEMNKGRVVNNISGSLASKELSIILKEDVAIRSLLASGHFTFSLNGQFVFAISIKQEVVAELA